MRRKTIGLILICLGILSLAAAIWLVARNVNEETTAEQISQEVVRDLEIVVQEASVSFEEDPLVLPDYEYNPDMEMPEQEINGHLYIATLEIPDLELSLPIMSELTMPKLKIAPCRYEGTTYQENLIIGAHNYDSHFGRLKTLSYGSQMTLTDMDGNEFVYEVVDIEILQPNQVEDLRSGNWSLTLFTCTPGGQTRVVVRCESVDTI